MIEQCWQSNCRQMAMKSQETRPNTIVAGYISQVNDKVVKLDM